MDLPRELFPCYVIVSLVSEDDLPLMSNVVFIPLEYDFFHILVPV